ncbi:hypothetical protein PFISCL1PPCAC_13708, partial [Pristionchus fissidentatus]
KDRQVMSLSDEMKDVPNSEDVSLKNPPPLSSDDDEIPEDPTDNTGDASLNPPLHNSTAPSSTDEGPVPTMQDWINAKDDETRDAIMRRIIASNKVPFSPTSTSSSNWDSEIGAGDGVSSSSSSSLEQKFAAAYAAAAGRAGQYAVSLSSIGSSAQSEKPHRSQEARKRRHVDGRGPNEGVVGGSFYEPGTDAGSGPGSPHPVTRNRCNTAPEQLEMSNNLGHLDLGLSGSLEEN